MTQGQLPSAPQIASQMSFLCPTEPLWCERTQDMSGYVLPHIISPPLDEQLDLTFSTALPENDFYIQNSGNPSPEEFNLGEQTEAILGEDPKMFDNANYSVLDTKIKAWLPEISEIDEFAKNSMIEESGTFFPRIDSENSIIFSEMPKVIKKPSATIDKKPKYLSMFEYEEPHIKEDPEVFSSCCTDSKLTFELKDDMEVAEEVVVTTEEYEPKHQHHKGSSLFSSPFCELPIEPKEEIVTDYETELLPTPLGRSSNMEPSYDLDLGLVDDSDFLYSITEPASPTSDSEPKVYPRLRLDIEAATISSTQLPYETLSDTPEVLKPVLKPGEGFDLVNFLLKGDTNNNAVSLSTGPSLQKVEEPRLGKSHLSLSDLKACQRYGRGKPSLKSVDERIKPVPGTSRHISASGRPARRSATKFKKLLEEGLLDSTLDSNSVSSEDDEPRKRKRRISGSSTSSRKRLNSDSDMSSIGDNQLKYRERRDRNNLSSKRSRQKRKMQQELKKLELKDLEEENKKLKKKADELAAVLEKVHAAWKKYLEEKMEKNY